MVGKHRLLTGRQLRATMVELVDLYTLTTHLMAPGSAVTPGFRGHVALCGADVTPSAFVQPPGDGHCQSCRTSVPTQRSGKTR
jgi:hypothetical protein